MLHSKEAIECAERLTAIAIANNLIIKKQTNEETAKEIALFFNVLKSNMDNETGEC